MDRSAATGAQSVPWSAQQGIQSIIVRNLKGENVGIYSVCCSHRLVLEAAVDQAVSDGSMVLIEATANQVNQFGGYTGLRPAEFRDYVYEIGTARGMPAERIVLGGDHLGPVCWKDEESTSAMEKADDLVRTFASAGFGKIHLDCSMPLLGDGEHLDDAVVAARAARLCAAAEDARRASYGDSDIIYVIGTEVPPPGGADEALEGVTVTRPERARHTLEIHKQAFLREGLQDAWRRVVALVVQPGVEFDNGAIVEYLPGKAAGLRELATRGTSGIAFEAHSTDYQQPTALTALVRDHFAVLKVGPALTFACREALFALAHIEAALIVEPERSNLIGICDTVMRERPQYWQRFYHGDEHQKSLLRLYSLSDRIRYYWPDPAVQEAVDRLLGNLDGVDIPVGLLSQFLPGELSAVRSGTILPTPIELVKSHIRRALAPYVTACAGSGGAR